MQRILRSGAVAIAALLVVPTLQSPAQADPVPTSAGSTWLLRQLSDGVVHNDQFAFDDYGLTVDVALGLAGVNGNQDAVVEIADAVEPHVADYVTGGAFAPDDRYAGSTAKAVVLAQVAGADPTTYGGDDLVTRLESLTADAAPVAGRIGDVSEFGDFANTIGQSFAARALTVAGSTEADAATAFLLQQQCTPGYFRLLLNPERTAAEQGCVDDDGTGSPADLDATALAVLNLAASGSTAPAVEAALADARTWLLSRQGTDGSFGGGPSTEAPNANSTGLGGWALGVLGEPAAAGKAAVWVRRHQAVSNGRCTDALTGEQGAIAYDDAALAAGRADGIPDELRDQWRRASAQAMPVLRFAPRATGERAASGATGFVKAGYAYTLTATGVAPGDTACAWTTGSTGAAVASAAGSAAPRVVTPAGTADRLYTVTDSRGRVGQVTLKVLGRLTVPFTMKSIVRKGAKQTVTATGLRAGETVTVYFRGAKVRSGTASSTGRFTATFVAGGPVGKATVKVTGHFPALRTATKTFRVS